jgi:hypothetical protein
LRLRFRNGIKQTFVLVELRHRHIDRLQHGVAGSAAAKPYLDVLQCGRRRLPCLGSGVRQFLYPLQIGGGLVKEALLNNHAKVIHFQTEATLRSVREQLLEPVVDTEPFHAGVMQLAKFGDHSVRRIGTEP